MTKKREMTVRAWPTGERDEVIARIAAHRAADEIVQGTGFENGQGCAIGCSLDTYSHKEYCRVVLGESAHNLLLAGLIDDIHETLPREQSLDWPGRVAEALQPGADMSLCLKRWLHWLLTVELRDFPDAQPMGALMGRSLAGGEPTKQEWDDCQRATRDARAAWAARDARAARAAWDARDARAAWDARDARAARAAWDARDARDARAAWAAWDARAARAAWDARDARDARAARAAWDARATWAARATRDARAAVTIRMADALIEIMRDLPVAEIGEEEH